MKVMDCKIKDEYVTCDVNDNIVEISKKMGQNKRFNHVLVLKQGKLVGVISIRDIVERVIAREEDPFRVLAGNIMTSPVTTILGSKDVQEAAKMMTSMNFLSLPVVDENEHLLGVVSIYDIIEKFKES